MTLYVGFVLFLISTDPRKLAVGWLMLPFVWLGFTLYLTCIFLFSYLRSKGFKRPKRPRLAGAVIAAIPAFLLLLDSINQLTLRDGLILGTFGIIIVFYGNRVNLRAG